MTKGEAKNLGQEEAFLHIEARLNQALEETEKKYGKDMASIVRGIIHGTVHALIEDASELPCPLQVALCAWLETIARWNEQIDKFIRK
jgi:hypothetical protein